MLERWHFGSSWKWVLIGAIAFGLIVAWFFLPVTEWLESFSQFARGLGSWGVLAFAVIYILGTVFMAPGSPMTIAIGVTYGLWGIPIAWVSAVIGASFAFLIGRYSARERIRRMMRKYPRSKVIREAVDRNDWKIVILLRLCPLVPFNLQNYFFGITNIGFWSYLLATVFGIIPGTVVYVYLGSLGTQIAGGNTIEWELIIIRLLIIILVFWLIRKKIKPLLV